MTTSALRSWATVGLFAALAGVTTLGCAAQAGGDAEMAESELRTTYVEMESVLSEDDWNRWYDVRRELIAGFDRVCGDTICSGDFSNLTTVDLGCSATSSRHKLRDCAWVLGGDIAHVDPKTGAITHDARTWRCDVPVGSRAEEMIGALSAAGQDALNTTVPGTTGSFYDALVTCFAGVSGAPIADAAGPWLSVEDYFWSGGGDGAKWSGTQQRLAQGFDDVCGDSFCEGEYADIVSVDFTCAVNGTTKRVSSCDWTFAGAELSVTRSRGDVRAATMTKTCSVTVDATASALARALGGADPLHAKLPGKTTSLYDALIGCL